MEPTPHPLPGFTGTVNLQLADLIQMVCLSRSDLVITVRSAEGDGRIYVKGGRIRHAHTGTMDGEEAFFEIFRWKDGRFEMLPFSEALDSTIDKGWEHLLVEAVRRTEEDDTSEETGETGPDESIFDGIERMFDGIEPSDSEGPEGEGFVDMGDMFVDLSSVPAGEGGRENSNGSESGLILDAAQQVSAWATGLFESETPVAESASETPREEPVTRVLIVEDSKFFSRQMERILLEDPRIQVAGIARNGREALEILDSAGESIDLATLDIRMPVMQGDTALKHIMIRYPVPVLIVSALPPDDWTTVLEFLRLGAVDFIPKPGTAENADLYGGRLREMVRGAARAQTTHFRRRRKPSATARGGVVGKADELLAILGAEGSYMNWFRLPLARLSGQRPVVGVQRLPEGFLPGFCNVLERETSAVAEPVTDLVRLLEPGKVHVGSLEEARAVGASLSLAAPEDRSWDGDVGLWIEWLEEQAPGGFSLYLLSGARPLPPDVAERLLDRGDRIILSPRETVMCTELVDSVEPYMHVRPEQAFRADAEELLEVS